MKHWPYILGYIGAGFGIVSGVIALDVNAVTWASISGFWCAMAHIADTQFWQLFDTACKHLSKMEQL